MATTFGGYWELLARELLALAAFTAAVFGLLWRMQARLVPYLTAMSQATAALFGFLEERLAGIEDLQPRAAGAYVLRLYHRYVQTRFERVLRYQTSTPNVVLSFAQAPFVGGNVLALALAATFFAAGALTLGTVFLIYQYANTLAQPIRALVTQLQDFQAATASIERLVELTRLRSAVWDGGDHLPRRRLDARGRVQRTAAAHMFVAEPELLVFDHLSSALDVGTEGALWERLFGDAAAGGGNSNGEARPTALAVSHRRPVPQRADLVAVLKNGAVEAPGRLGELLARSEEMQRLWMGEPAPRR